MKQSVRNGSAAVFACLLLLVFAYPGLSQSQAYRRFPELEAAVRDLASRYPQLVEVTSIGKSVEGRELLLITLTDRQSGSPGSKPALFVVGNLEGQHVAASELILGIAQELARGWSRSDSIRSLLRQCTFYLLPRANPDGAERLFGKVRWEQAGNVLPWDDDFDDAADEDGPEDLNGDGWITQMRVPDPDGDYLADPQEPRLLRKVDRSKGESGQYKVYTEGLDNDGDGEYNEDGLGGICLDRNFPHSYPYHQPGAGRYQLQAPEARAIVDFLLGHRNVAASLAYCLHENLLLPSSGERQSAGTAPTAETGTLRAPAAARRQASAQPATSLHEDDLPYYRRASEVFRKLVGVGDRSLITTPKPEGAYFEWAYFQYGIPSFATPGWYPAPESGPAPKSDTSGAEGPPTATSLARSLLRSARAPQERVGESLDAEWLRWFDKHAGGAGFLPWRRFRHPQLGEVEIGGFLPGARVNPPDSLLPELIRRHARFCVELASWLPQIEVDSLNVQALGSEVYRLTLRVRNRGYFPTVLAHAVRARAVKPTRVEIETQAELLSGNKYAFLEPIAGSKSQKTEWILRGKKGQEVRIAVIAEKAGTVRRTIRL